MNERRWAILFVLILRRVSFEYIYRWVVFGCFCIKTCIVCNLISQHIRVHFLLLQLLLSLIHFLITIMIYNIVDLLIRMRSFKIPSFITTIRRCWSIFRFYFFCYGGILLLHELLSNHWRFPTKFSIDVIRVLLVLKEIIWISNLHLTLASRYLLNLWQ